MKWEDLWSSVDDVVTPDPTKPDGISSLFGGSGSLWGPLIMAGGSLANSYFTQDQAATNNELAIQQANAQRDFAAAQNDKEIAARAEAERLRAEAAQKIAKMNNMAQLYQTWGTLNQRAGEAQSQTALQTGKNASDAISVRAAALR